MWENILLNSYGIRATRTPGRRDRLIAWAQKVDELAKALKRKYKQRVAIVPLGRLDDWCRKLLRKLGGTRPWSNTRGRNRSGSSRHELRHAAKRRRTLA